MKTICIILVLLGSISGVAQSRLEKEVLKLSKDKFRWLVEKKLDSLNQLLDQRLSYIHSNGWVQTKKELLDDLVSGKLGYRSISIISDSIRLYPKSAVITGRGKFEASLNGNTSVFDLAYTETYVLQKREWKLVSRHASRAQ